MGSTLLRILVVYHRRHSHTHPSLAVSIALNCSKLRHWPLLTAFDGSLILPAYEPHIPSRLHPCVLRFCVFIARFRQRLVSLARTGLERHLDRNRLAISMA